jgi:hypothetical protein
MTEQTTQQAPEPSPARESFSGDSDGIRAAADELIKRRGAETEATEGPGDMSEDRAGVQPDEAISLRAAAKELSDYRQDKQVAREKFEQAVYGEAGEEQSARPEGTQDLAQQIAGNIQQFETSPPPVQPAVQQSPAPAPLAHVEQQLAQYIEGQTATARQQIVNAIVEQYPEVQDQERLNELRTTWPQRYQEIAAAYAAGEQQLAMVQKSAQLDVVRYANGAMQQFNQWAQEQDAAFASRHPELNDPKVKAEVVRGTIDYLKSIGMTDQQIADGYLHGTGPVNLRHAAAQETLLRAARADMAKKNLANRPRKAAPRVVRPGSAGEITQVPDKHTTLERRLDNSGSIRDAARLVSARRADARRR